MLYQAFRAPKKRGGKKVSPPPKFNVEEYNSIVAPFKSSTSSVMYVTPKNPVGYECVNQYQKVIKALHQKQQTAGTSSVGWEFIWTSDCKELFQHVKECKPMINRANYVEKQAQDFLHIALSLDMATLRIYFGKMRCAQEAVGPFAHDYVTEPASCC